MELAPIVNFVIVVHYSTVEWSFQSTLKSYVHRLCFLCFEIKPAKNTFDVNLFPVNMALVDLYLAELLCLDDSMWADPSSNCKL